MKNDKVIVTEEALSNFYGTEHYYKYPLTKIVLTDGANYLIGKGLDWFIAEIVYRKEIIKNVFVSIKLIGKDNKGEIIWTDDNEEKHIIEISYTDFEGEVQIYLTNNVLMLISEY